MALKKEIWNDKQIWDYLLKHINNEYGVAGLCGNIKAESNYRSNNLQNTYEKKFGMTDDEFTNAVDEGRFDFCQKSPSFGYGLVQHTYFSRRQGLMAHCKAKGTSIADTEMQLEFIIQELKNYGLLDDLQNAKSIREASDLILHKYEKPADQSEAVEIKRCSYGEEIYNKYATTSSNTTTTTTTSSGSKMTNLEFVEILKKLVNTPTVYMYGAWGQPITENFIQQKAKQYSLKLYL